MILHSKIEKVLEKNIAGNEELLKKIEGKCGVIEREIDGLLNKKDVDIDDVLDRAKILIERLLGGIWVSKNWYNVEKDIKKEIESSKW